MRAYIIRSIAEGYVLHCFSFLQLLLYYNLLKYVINIGIIFFIIIASEASVYGTSMSVYKYSVMRTENVTGGQTEFQNGGGGKGVYDVLTLQKSRGGKGPPCPP